MGPARVTLLGRPAVAHEGTWTPFRNERRFQLLAYLAVAGDWVGRDRLVALLWPELDEGKARRNLRKTVFQAREPAWAAALETEGDSVRWPVDTDLAAFRLAVQGGQLADACAMYRALCWRAWTTAPTAPTRAGSTPSAPPCSGSGATWRSPPCRTSPLRRTGPPPRADW